ncbi:MAG TPA: hypothetical protein VIJ27_07625 [Mucilaginibacter sp.]
METIIKVSPNELDENLLNKIKKFINGKDNIDVTISLKEFDPEYADALGQSIGEAEKDENLFSFTMESFMAYKPSRHSH